MYPGPFGNSTCEAANYNQIAYCYNHNGGGVCVTSAEECDYFGGDYAEGVGCGAPGGSGCSCCKNLKSVAPSAAPTVTPSVAPTMAPTFAPTVTPSAAPTTAPTTAPTVPSNALDCSDFGPSRCGWSGAWTVGTADASATTCAQGGSTGEVPGVNGTFAFANSTGATDGEFAFAYSPLSLPSAAYFSFSYCMAGVDVGSLTLELTTDGATFTSVWVASGAQGSDWITSGVELDASTTGLRFTAVTSGPDGDIGVDTLQTFLTVPTSQPVPAPSRSPTFLTPAPFADILPPGYWPGPFSESTCASASYDAVAECWAGHAGVCVRDAAECAAFGGLFGSDHYGCDSLSGSGCSCCENVGATHRGGSKKKKKFYVLWVFWFVVCLILLCCCCCLCAGLVWRFGFTERSDETHEHISGEKRVVTSCDMDGEMNLQHHTA